MHPHGWCIVVGRFGAGDEVGVEVGDGEIVGGQRRPLNAARHDLREGAVGIEQQVARRQMLRFDPATAGVAPDQQRRSVDDKPRLGLDMRDVERMLLARDDYLSRVGVICTS